MLSASLFLFILFYILLLFIFFEGANNVLGSAEKGGPFGTRIHTMPYIGS